MGKMMKNLLIYGFLSLTILSCKSSEDEAYQEVIDKKEKIVSLNGTITEVLHELEVSDRIVGVDITSTYPESLNNIPRLGHISQVKAEGIIALDPDVVMVKSSELKPDLKEQLLSAEIKLVEVEQDYSTEGTIKLINEIADKVQQKEKAKSLIENLNNDLAGVESIETPPSVLFIYARGASSLMVAGENTQMQSIIQMAGGKNAVQGFDDFKALSPEVLITSNPDVILMFESGKRSLNGEEGLLQIPGMNETNAGKNGHFITMDGLYLSGFGPRLGQATKELNQKLKEISEK